MPVGAGGGIPGPQLSGMNEAFSDRNLIKMGAASSLPVAKVIGTSAQHLGRSCLAAFGESPSLRCAPAYPCAGSWRARLGDRFEAERLEPQEYFGIEQRAGMYAEKPHGTAPSRQPSGPRLTWLPNDRREMPP